jgi:hypothetical protein
MRIRTAGAAVAAALLVLAPCRALSQADTTLHVTQFMSPAELDSTGLSTLTGAQRAALDAWLARYTATMAAQMAQHTAPQAIVIRHASVANGFRVSQVLGDGSRVALDDGTVWKIDLPDRPTVDTWRVGDFVLVRQNPAPERGGQEEFAYTLQNGRDRRDPAKARLVGRLPGGQP